MQSEPIPQTTSKGMWWAGWVVGGLPALFLLLDGVMKLLKPAPILEATEKLGYPASTILGMGIVLIVSDVLYLLPSTSVLGAILLTGYLGGATASHVRIGDPMFAICFPVIFGVFIWGGLWLRDARLRALTPIKN
jgi:hypothetical protein